MSPLPANPPPASSPAAAGGPRIRVEAEPTASGTVLRLGGEIDTDTAGQLEAALARLLPDGDGGTRLPVLLDLSGVSFCDSTGLNVLLRARLRARRRHVLLSITAVSEQVARLLDITRTDTLFGLPSPRGPRGDGRRRHGA
ncbi:MULTISPECIES: STAS domain-containing protein [unclassified Streptomyces]|uniref:STAS domain-containing protein n=1 Tax=unclassified Streptomyces TaxID=2593676 RepID=UPI0036F804D4